MYVIDLDAPEPPGPWELVLALGSGLQLRDGRERLAPDANGWTVRLLIGVDDGTARQYEVDVHWDGDAGDAHSALDSVVLAVREL